MTTKAKHTPGPWSVVGLPPERYGFENVVADGPIAVAQVFRGESVPRAEGYANARLIAAAPTMYATLRCYFDDPERFNKMASDALALVEG